MGLTIHYELQAPAKFTSKKLIEVLNQIRELAIALKFEYVGDVLDLKYPKTDFNLNKTNDQNLNWFLIQCGQCVDFKEKGSNYSKSVPPLELIGLNTWPGEGCEGANFGFCIYPKEVAVTRKMKVKTKLKKWSWKSFCKTQYASQEGLDNFLKCHVGVVTLLDKFKELGIKTDVSDEGEYWEKRNIEELAKEVGSYNEFVAGMTGKFEEIFGDKIEAPIKKFKDFEHLEAKGLDKMKKD